MTIAPDGSIIAPPEVMGCGSTKLYKTSDDLTAAGPWPVGVKTAMLTLSGVSMPVEIWYPAPLGADSGKTQATYDLAVWLPKGQAMLIPDSANKLAVCNCYRDLPLDTSHGPYPAVIFIHGTGSFRVANMSTMTAWASRGFIAVAADHPGLFLTDFLASGNCQGGGTGTTERRGHPRRDERRRRGRRPDEQVRRLRVPRQQRRHVAHRPQRAQPGRVGRGHCLEPPRRSQRAGRHAARRLRRHGAHRERAQIRALHGRRERQRRRLFVRRVARTRARNASIKRVIGIAGGDHLDVTDLCSQTNSVGKTGIQVADQYNVCGTGAPSTALTLLNALAKCGTVMPPSAGPGIVTYATTAALEETLHCINRDAAFSSLKTAYPQVSDFEHTP